MTEWRLSMLGRDDKNNIYYETGCCITDKSASIVQSSLTA